jgi:hypothetical protein
LVKQISNIKKIFTSDATILKHLRENEPQGVGPSGGGLGLKVCSILRPKVQHLMSAAISSIVDNQHLPT